MKITIACLCLLMLNIPLQSQPVPGNVFREYSWIPSMVKAEKGRFLRVGGKLDYKINFEHLPKHRQDSGYISFGHYVDLNNASKAEVVLEKIGSHEDTNGLRISINRNESIVVPVAKGIPEPEADYMHHTYPVVKIPLGQFNEGIENSFRLDVDTVQKWNWPQNIIYGITLRIYYDTNNSDLKNEISGIEPGNTLKKLQTVAVENPKGNIRRVEYIAFHDGVNFEGDGNYQQWHYHYFRGQVVHHIGSANMYPFSVDWDTSWLPDQRDIKVAARVVSNSGLIYFTQPVSELKLEREHLIELCKPYDQPKNWVTRAGEFETKIEVKGDVEEIEEVRLYWVSWSPCYSNGIYINGVKVFDKEGPCYEYMAHEVVLDDYSMLKNGTNIIKTGKEPLHDGQMVHGMEVQWPGIMMKVKYSD